MGNWPTKVRNANRVVFYASSQCLWPVTHFQDEEPEAQRLVEEVREYKKNKRRRRRRRRSARDEVEEEEAAARPPPVAVVIVDASAERCRESAASSTGVEAAGGRRGGNDDDAQTGLTAEKVGLTLREVARVQTRLSLRIYVSLILCVSAGVAWRIAVANNNASDEPFSQMLPIYACMIGAPLVVLGVGLFRCATLNDEVAEFVAGDWGIPRECVEFKHWKPQGKMTPERLAHVVVNLSALRDDENIF